MAMLGPVPESSELARIRSLPRRTWSREQLASLAEQWSPMLLNARGRAEWDRCAQLPPEQREAELRRLRIRLMPVQAQALYEAVQDARENLGIFLAAPVGAGKTLVSFLLPLVLGAKRPVLLIPATLRRETERKFEDIAQYWRAPRPMPHLENYEGLSRESHQWKLCGCPVCKGTETDEGEGLRPDLLIADEADRLRNKTAVARVRVARFASRHPEVTVCEMSGTLFRKSIREIAPLLVLARKLRAPAPLTYVDLETWCGALDEKPRGGVRRSPGALLTLSDVRGVGDEVTAARYAFRDRLASTPGVIVLDEQSCNQPLTLRVVKGPDTPVLDDSFLEFRTTDATPDGWDVGDPLSRLRHATELGCEFYYKWDPRPPKAWCDARSNWFRFVREQIAGSQRAKQPLDSAQMVANAFRDHPVRRAWVEIEPTFKPNTVAVPLGSSVLHWIVDWMRVNTPALVWVAHTFVGDMLSRLSKVPFFQGGGLDLHGREIELHNPRESAIASLSGNFRGRNLQAWNKALVVAPQPAGTLWEQGYLGRLHRQGQEHPVHVDVLVTCAENLKALQSAHLEAHGVKEQLGHTQKLLVADFDWSQFPGAELSVLSTSHPSAARWRGAFQKISKVFK